MYNFRIFYRHITLGASKWNWNYAHCQLHALPSCISCLALVPEKVNIFFILPDVAELATALQVFIKLKSSPFWHFFIFRLKLLQELLSFLKERKITEVDVLNLLQGKPQSF